MQHLAERVQIRGECGRLYKDDIVCGVSEVEKALVCCMLHVCEHGAVSCKYKLTVTSRHDLGERQKAGRGGTERPGSGPAPPGKRTTGGNEQAASQRIDRQRRCKVQESQRLLSSEALQVWVRKREMAQLWEF